MKNLLLLIFPLTLCGQYASAQNDYAIEGLVCIKGPGQRLSGISVFNKANKARSVTNDIGIFRISGSKTDTIEFKGDGFEAKDTVIAKVGVLMVYLNKIAAPTMLDEVTINSTSLKQDILQTKRIYRSKGVFYTGTPHYYYLFLKPMTFIYENFKGEVIAARKFKKIAANDLEGQEIRLHFNRDVVKRAVPDIPDEQIDSFLVDYWPTIKQVRIWNYYDMIKYIRRSYMDYGRQNIASPDSGLIKNFDWDNS